MRSPQAPCYKAVLMNRISHIFVLFAACLSAALAGGCSPTEKEDQPAGVFYFPTGITVHPGQRYAYVVSSNFDLGYKTGTVKVLDLQELEAEILADAAGTGCGGRPCADTHFSGAIVESATRRVGSFGGTAALDPTSSKLFVSLRQDGQVALMDVGEEGRALDCAGDTADTPDREPGSFTGDCHKSRLYKTGHDDPFVLAWGSNPVAPGSGCMYAAHLKEGQVTCMNVDEPAGEDAAVSFTADFSRGLSPSGVNDFTFDAAGRIFVANRFILDGANVVAAADPLSMLGAPGQAWWFDVAYIVGGAEQKSLVLTKDGGTMYLLTRLPDALVKMAAGTDSYGTPMLETIDYTPAGIWPERLFMLESAVPARRLLYVTCSDNDYIHVFDGVTLEQVAQLRDGLDGPYWMAFYDLGTGPRALVANFENSTVTVITIDPVTLEHRTIAVVGAPRKKASGEY